MQCADCVKDSVGLITKILYLMLAAMLAGGAAGGYFEVSRGMQLNDHELEDIRVTTELQEHLAHVEVIANRDRTIFIESVKSLRSDIKSLSNTVKEHQSAIDRHIGYNDFNKEIGNGP